MKSRIFFWNVLARVGLIIATSFVLIGLIESLVVEWLFTLIVGGTLIVLQVFMLTRYVLKLSRVMEDFVEAVGNADSPEIRFRSSGALFNKLEERANAIQEGIQARRLEKEKDDRILISAINSADFGLLCLNSLGEVHFSNETATGMITGGVPKHLDQIQSRNPKIWEILTQITPGSPRVMMLHTPARQEGGSGSDRLVSIRLKNLDIFDETFRLFSFQDIQEELHKNESDSWQKIIRVLTHEIMNAVAPMLSLTTSLQTRLKTGAKPELGKIADGLRMIESTGKGLMDFTGEYRRLSLLPLPKKERMDLSGSIQGIVLLFETEARDRGIELSTRLDAREAQILADPQQFEMVMINLIKNAFESFEKMNRAREVLIRTERGATGIGIFVEDKGCGIPADLLDQVFVPFFSTREQGSGIGLSLARQIMNNHGASIQLESTPEEGTRVSLLFKEAL